MKKIFTLIGFVLCTIVMTGCLGTEKEDVASSIDDDGSGRMATKNEIITTWQSSDYKGWEPRLEQDVVISRGLKLLGDGTYENKYRGHLTQAKDGSSLSTTEFGEWEIETGTWSFNASTSEITYHPTSDQRINYDTKEMETYTLDNYSEKCIIKEKGEYKEGWITLDTYLKRAGNKGDLRYVMKKGSKSGN